jgi:hypothetical protein
VVTILGTVLALLVLSVLVRLERWIDARREREALARAGRGEGHVHQGGDV